MNNRYTVPSLIFFVANMLSSCSNYESKSVKSVEVEFDQIELIQNDASGNKSWEIVSPEAIFDVESENIKANKPKVTLFSNNKPNYELTGNRIKSINNMQELKLEGNILIQVLSDKNSKMQSKSLIWRPSDSNLLLQDNPSITTKNANIKSSSIEFNSNQDIISFNGLTHYQLYIDSFKDDNFKITIKTNDAKWNLNTNQIYSDNSLYAYNNSKDPQENFTIKADSFKGDIILPSLNLSNCTFQKNIPSVYTISEKCSIQKANFDNRATKIFAPFSIFKKNNNKIEFFSTSNQVTTKLRLSGLNNNSSNF